MSNETKVLPLNAKCTKRGCDGLVDFADMGEVYDGERAKCDTCGRCHVAVEYPDEVRAEHDKEEERRSRGKRK